MSMSVMSMEHGLEGLDTDLKGFFRAGCQKIVMSILNRRVFRLIDILASRSEKNHSSSVSNPSNPCSIDIPLGKKSVSSKFGRHHARKNPFKSVSNPSNPCSIDIPLGKKSVSSKFGRHHARKNPFKSVSNPSNPCSIDITHRHPAHRHPANISPPPRSLKILYQPAVHYTGLRAIDPNTASLLHRLIPCCGLPALLCPDDQSLVLKKSDCLRR
jgi:hypothetical protein